MLGFPTHASDFHTSYLLLFTKFSWVSILYMIFSYPFCTDNASYLSMQQIDHTAFIQGHLVYILLFPRLILEEFY